MAASCWAGARASARAAHRSAAPATRAYGSPQWKRTVLAVKRRDGWRCQHCGATQRLVVDHRTPHARYPGSFFDAANLWVLCSADNNSKRDLTVEEWKAALARRAPTRPLTAGPTIRGIYSIGGRRR